MATDQQIVSPSRAIREVVPRAGEGKSNEQLVVRDQLAREVDEHLESGPEFADLVADRNPVRRHFRQHADAASPRASSSSCITRAGRMPMAVPCRTVSIVAERLLQVLTRAVRAPASANHWLPSRAGVRGGGYDQMELPQVGGERTRRGKRERRVREPAQLVLADRLAASHARRRSGSDTTAMSSSCRRAAADEAGVADEHRSLDARIALLQPPQQLGQAHQRKALVEPEPQHALQRIARAEALDHFSGRASTRSAYSTSACPSAVRLTRGPRRTNSGVSSTLLQLADALRHARLAEDAARAPPRGSSQAERCVQTRAAGSTSRS